MAKNAKQFIGRDICPAFKQTGLVHLVPVPSGRDRSFLGGIVVCCCSVVFHLVCVVHPSPVLYWF